MDTSFIRPGSDASRGRREHGAPPRRGLRTWLFGRPLPTADPPHQAIGKAVGLAVFSSDALSSTAYATQEIMIILAMAGTAALSLVLRISVPIAVPLPIVTFSYEQTIHAYPSGGGAYIVARDNLGDFPAQVAGAALLTDYILTVAVSISSAVAQVASASSVVHGHKVALAVFLVAFVMIVNLRGVKESGRVLALPTFFFVAMMGLTVRTAIVRHLLGALQPIADPPPLDVEPTRAVAAAERLAGLMPGAGHLVHMPGHIYIRVGRYEDAIKAFQQLKERYPYSKYAILAELKLGDAHFYSRDYADAAMAYEEFARLHPRNEVVPYVLYQVGMCHFLSFTTVDRDQEETRLAMEAFARLMQAIFAIVTKIRAILGKNDKRASKTKKSLPFCQSIDHFSRSSFPSSLSSPFSPSIFR